MLKRNFIPLFILVIIFLFVMKPDIVSEGVFNGLKIWINNMIPYLLPMSVLSNILLQYNFCTDCQKNCLMCPTKSLRANMHSSPTLSVSW